MPFGVSGFRQDAVERVTTLAVNFDLLQEREADAVGGGAERLNLFGAAGLLLAELIAGNAEDRETLVGVVLLHLFESGVLGREAALRGDVDDENNLAGVFVELGWRAVEVVDGGIENSHEGTIVANRTCHAFDGCALV